VQITGYSIDQWPHYAIGHPLLDNGEPDETRTVRVFLREDKDAGKREYARTEIADFANPRHKAATEAGGIIMFASAVETDTDGEFSARWADSVSHYVDEAACRAGYATVFFRTDGDRPYFSLEFYKPEAAILVDSVRAIEQALPDMLHPSSPSTGMAALIRLVSKEGDTVAVRAGSAWHKDESSGFSTVAPGLDSATKFYDKEDWKLIKQVFESGEVAMAEIIPGMRVNAIGATLKGLLKKPQRLEAMNTVYRDEEGHAVFTKTWFSARFHESGDPFLTALQRAASDSPRYRAANIPTANFDPSPEHALAPRNGAEQGVTHTNKEAGDSPAPHTESPRRSPQSQSQSRDPAASAPVAAEEPTRTRPPRAPHLKHPVHGAPAAQPTPAPPPPNALTDVEPQLPPGMDDVLELGDEDMKALEAFSMKL
jgi:hypothetical protein